MFLNLHFMCYLFIDTNSCSDEIIFFANEVDCYAAVVCAVATQQEGPGFDCALLSGLSVCSLPVLTVSAWVSVSCG